MNIQTNNINKVWETLTDNTPEILLGPFFPLEDISATTVSAAAVSAAAANTNLEQVELKVLVEEITDKLFTLNRCISDEDHIYDPDTNSSICDYLTDIINDMTCVLDTTA